MKKGKNTLTTKKEKRMQIKDWKLVHKDTGIECDKGDIVSDFRMNDAVVMGGQPPHKISSTGKVFVKRTGFEMTDTYYPSVFNLKWVIK